MIAAMKIAYFTAGTVGAGHLVRGLAIGRALRRTGFAGEYRMFGPRLPFAAAAGREDYTFVEAQTDRALRDRHLAQTSGLAEDLRRYGPDLLVVDLFWAPLRWVLPYLDCEAWLLLRICPPQWLIGPPEMPFAASPFARIVAIEPAAVAAVRDRIDPIVVCNRDECQPPEALRERLAVPREEPLVVALHAGERGESAAVADRAGPGARVLDLFDPEAPFPAAEWLPGADRIVAGAGYNAFWEAHWLGYAERTEWIPFRRSIDDQALRLQTGPVEDWRCNGADTLARWMIAG